MDSALFTDRAAVAQRCSRNHISLLALSIIALVFADRFLCEASSALVFRLSLATGYVAWLWLVVATSLGPLRVLRGRKAPVNTHLRRDVGIWCASMSVFHVAASLSISATGMVELQQFFFQRTDSGLALRTDTLGWANHTGALATIVVLVLLATSSDRAIRWLGVSRWKNLQRSVYLSVVLVVVHSVLYQLMIERGRSALTVFWVLTGSLIVLWIARSARARIGSGR